MPTMSCIHRPQGAVTRCELAAIACIGVLSAAGLMAAPPSEPAAIRQVEAELQRLAQLVPDWHTVRLPGGPGEATVGPEDALTIDQLRDVQIDPHPPVASERTVAYAPRQADDCPADDRPYVAPGIRPFRFRYFDCEFNYGGWHNFDMQDYAATHGFNIIYPYIRTREEIRHWPNGTLVLTWGGFVNWHEWLPENDIPEGRYDLLTGIDVVKHHLDRNLFRRDPDAKEAKAAGDLLMIDQEHPVLSPEKLREQEWYPKDASEPGRGAFERRYYDGYAQTYISSVTAARRQGWQNISIYGWYPYGRTWGGLEKAEPDPGTDFAWNAFGRQILGAVDVVNNSVYCFYWTAQNVAYTLANIDLNLRMVQSADQQKRVRPYFWTLLHGGGGGWRWWRGQPLPNEEKRAMIAMAFFTGIDGFVTWNWSGTGSHHTVRLRSKVTRTEEGPEGERKKVSSWQYHDVMVAEPFNAVASGVKESCQRHDVLHILGVNDDDGTVTFQKIRHGKKNHGVDAQYPVFSMSRDSLLPRLRRKSEPVGAMVEGMALVKPLETLIRHGEICIDVPAQQQFGQKLPVLRRVRLGRWHAVITYDPGVVHGDTPRDVVLTDFGGVVGRTLRLPADEQTRVFVLEEP